MKLELKSSLGGWRVLVSAKMEIKDANLEALLKIGYCLEEIKGKKVERKGREVKIKDKVFKGQLVELEENRGYILTDKKAERTEVELEGVSLGKANILKSRDRKKITKAETEKKFIENLITPNLRKEDWSKIHRISSIALDKEKSRGAASFYKAISCFEMGINNKDLQKRLLNQARAEFVLVGMDKESELCENILLLLEEKERVERDQ